MGLFSNIFGANAYSNRELKRIEPIKNKILALDEEYQELSDTELKAYVPLISDDTFVYNFNFSPYVAFQLATHISNVGAPIA